MAERTPPDRMRGDEGTVSDDSASRGSVVQSQYEEPTAVQEEVVHSSSSSTEAITRTLSSLTGILLVVAELTLGLRLAFKLATASTGSSFVTFIYDVSNQLIRPFKGIFSTRVVGDTGIFEPSILIAMVIYLIAALLLVSVIQMVAGIPPQENRTLWQQRRYRILRW